jgi:hypothetical protein
LNGFTYAEGVQNRKRKHTSSSSTQPTATKVIALFRKIPGYNYMPSSMRGLFERFILFIIFF